ncbi:MAG: hypothetical protein N2484_08895 [Clostridia bacterium]|nr:hypothetical protein [Clostridia bacterium]
MKQYIERTKKINYIASLILAGMVLFIALSTFGINKLLLNPGFHKQLFVKNDLYAQTYHVIKNSMDGFIDGFKKNSPKDYEQHKDIFSMIEKSVTPEMVSSNLDNIREDSFQYFNGKRMFLPDIYLGSFAKYEPENTKEKAGDNKLSVETISKIEKINLSAILLYINRSDITDQFVIIKLIYYILSSSPDFALLVFLFLLLFGILSSRSAKEMLKWIQTVFIFAGVLTLLSGVGLMIYSWLFLPANVKFIAMSLPIRAEVIISYMRDCIINISVYLLVCSAMAAVFSFLMKHLEKRLPSILSRAASDTKAPEPSKKSWRMVLGYTAFVVLFLGLISGMTYKVYAFKSGLDSRDLSTVLDKMKTTNKVTQVISAKNDTIYALQIKLVDAQRGTAVTNTPINITGTSALLKKEFNETVPTDEQGITKFILDEGTFRVSFIQSDFPAGFQIPSPFFIDLKTAGTTIITVNIDKIPEIHKQNWGIAEIEVLDKDNNPVPELQVTIPGLVSAPGNPDSVFSKTNSEGIAVFKLNEGNYAAVFTEADFPKKYQLPSPVSIFITPNTITRYTIRLAEPPPPKPQPKPATPVPRTGTKKRS